MGQHQELETSEDTNESCKTQAIELPEKPFRQPGRAAMKNASSLQTDCFPLRGAPHRSGEPSTHTPAHTPARPFSFFLLCCLLSFRFITALIFIYLIPIQPHFLLFFIGGAFSQHCQGALEPDNEGLNAPSLCHVLLQVAGV